MSNVVETLRARGLFEAATSETIADVVETSVTIYAGFDPTSSSLQVGNLVAIMGLAHFQRAGHKVIALVGGATGMIGDPSGKSAERTLLTEEAVAENVVGIRENLERFLDFDHATAPAAIVNNNDWFSTYGFVPFLRDVGKHFRMGSMLGKDSVKSRLNSDAGMSFTEFSYQLLQGYDFLHLLDNYGCTMQLGGSDQWGNIIAGTDLIRKLRGSDAYGLTLPLICDSTGQKFGKSAGNAIYLSEEKTSCYDFYQFFVRTVDADVVRFLKVFTFLSIEEIDALAGCVAEAPERREAQKRLAEEVTRNVHGEAGLAKALRSTAVLHGEAMDGLNADDLMAVFVDVPSAELARASILEQPVLNVAAEAGLCKSRGEARRLIQNGGLYLNNVRVTTPEACVAAGEIIDEQLLVLRSGKKRYLVVRVAGS